MNLSASAADMCTYTPLGAVLRHWIIVQRLGNIAMPISSFFQLTLWFIKNFFAISAQPSVAGAVGYGFICILFFSILQQLVHSIFMVASAFLLSILWLFYFSIITSYTHSWRHGL
jgi:hypothetical protein